MTLLPEELDLHRGFDAFIDASRRLEQSYADLQARAAAIDLELAHTNSELEQTLLEREMVFASLPVGLLSLAPTGAPSDTVRWCNPEGRRLCGVVQELGRDLTALSEGEWEAGGVHLRIRRTRMSDGGTLVLVEDRSQVVHLEREVDRLDRMAGLSELALGIAHEIKNPLNGVMGFAALLERCDDAVKQRGYATKIGSGLRQVDSIVKALLAFARPADKIARPMTVPLVIAEAASGASVPADRVAVRLAPMMPADTQIDGTVLVRVLANLFRNSAEACADARIDVHGECVGQRLVLTVADNGPGVAIEDAERVFQPFFTTKDRGHGLGLALACRVLTFLDGSLDLLNPGEPGAVFRVTAPLCGTVDAGRGTKRRRESVRTEGAGA